LVGIDLVSAALAWTLTFYLGAISPFGHWDTFLHKAVAVTTVVLCTTILMAWNKLYLRRVCTVRAFELAGLIRVALLTGLIAVGAAAIIRLHLSWEWAAFGAALMFLVDNSARVMFGRWLRARRAKGGFSRNVVLVGDNEEALHLYQLTQHHPEAGLRVVGVVSSQGSRPSDAFDVPWLGTIDDLPNAVDRVNGVMVATSALSTTELNRAVRVLLEAEVSIQLSSGLSGISYQRLRPLPLARQPMFYVEPLRPSRTHLAAKRCLDVVIASTLLGLTAPSLAAAALAIKISDRRAPVLFSQERVGRGGRPFTLYKLRTMVPNAAARLEEVRSLNQRSGPLFKMAGDPRVTPIGRFLRQTSIDELPQLINVLRGDMSLVGPRPALASEVAKFDPAHLARQDVAPGLTGLWQVEARDNPSFYAYRRLDLFYVENWSLTLVLAIMLATAMVVAGSTLRALRYRLLPSRKPALRSLH
jgi:exopolysaccharide biosynthesis polyprenyl glycosylphosphotransferase